MAFCTSCGAQVNGAFCTQCGTRLNTAAGAAAPGPAAQPMPAPPARTGTSPVVWIIAILGGLFLLGAIGVIGMGFFVARKAKEFASNPGYATAKLMMAANPNFSEVSHDDGAGTITIRDSKTGKVMTWNFDDIKNGKFRISAQDENGQTATVEFGGGSGKLPAWVPEYPGTDSKATFSVSAHGTDTSGGSGAGGNFSFTTADAVSKVMDFYRDKAKALGMDTKVAAQTMAGEMLTATDEAGKRTLTVVAANSDGKTTVNVTFGGKD
jgi:hypothetical protein